VNRKLNVLVVDDSPTIRSVLKDILNSDPQIHVTAAVEDPFEAAAEIKLQIPDVITLDIEMPRMDGLTFLKKIMQQHPIPVIIISSLTKQGTDIAFKALEYGAVDVIEKPKLSSPTLIEEAKVKLCDIVKAAAASKMKKQYSPIDIKPKYSADVILPKVKARTLPFTDKIIVLGASTGGTEAIRVFLEQMPVNCPGIVIVQHMPEKFTYSFAERLNQICKINVKEAENGDIVERGKAIIAQGNLHILLQRRDQTYFVELKDGQLVNRHRPSVDVLFRSAAYCAGSNAVGVIMTGMGDDGARGMGELKETGAFNIAQDENSSVVYGMPKEALKYAPDAIVLPLDKIAPYILSKFR